MASRVGFADVCRICSEQPFHVLRGCSRHVGSHQWRMIGDSVCLCLRSMLEAQAYVSWRSLDLQTMPSQTCPVQSEKIKKSLESTDLLSGRSI